MHTVARICLSFCLGMFAATVFGISYPFLSSVVFVIAAIVCFLLGKRFPIKRIGICLLIAALSSMYFSGYLLMTYDRALQFGGETAVISGTVKEISERDSGYTYTVKTERIEDVNFPISISVNLYTEEKLDATYGDSLTVSAELYSVEAPSAVALWGTSASKGIDLTGSVVEITDITSGRLGFSGLCLTLRDTLRNSVRLNVSSPESGVLEGILFGKRDNIPYSVTRDFNRTGISHVLAVSGLHISIFTALILGLFSMLKIPPKTSRLSVLAFLAIFCAMAGFTPSVVRACLMTAVLTFGKIGNRYISSLDTLCIAAMIILLFSPYCIVNLSFLLSFLSVLGILLFAKPLGRKLCKYGYGKPRKTLAESVSVSIAAMIFTIPILAIAFGCFSVLSPITNLLVIPLTAPIMAFGFLTAITGLFFPPLAYLFGFVAQQLCSILITIASVLSDIPFAVIPTGFEYVPYLIFACMLLFAVTFIGRKRTNALFFVTALLCVNMTLISAFSYQLVNMNQLEITVFENLYHNPVLIRCCDKTVLINCTNEYGAKTVCSYMDSHGISKIDAVAFCGTDYPSPKGLDILSDEVPIGCVYLPSEKTVESFSVITDKEDLQVVSADSFGVYFDPIKIQTEDIMSEDVLIISCNGFTIGYSANGVSLAEASDEQYFNFAILDSETMPGGSDINAGELFWLRDDTDGKTSSDTYIIPTGVNSRIVTNGKNMSVEKGAGW